MSVFIPGMLFRALGSLRPGDVELRGPSPHMLPVAAFEGGDVLLLVARYPYRLSHKYAADRVCIFLGPRTFGWLSELVAKQLLSAHLGDTDNPALPDKGQHCQALRIKL